MTGVSVLQSIDESSCILWLLELKNRLINGDRSFLLFNSFSFMVYLLIVVINNKEHRIYYYFL